MRDLTALNAARRDADLAAVAGGGLVDVLVIGGGITGAGIALDAASRGLTAVLVEKHDLAFGTSRWSSKLVHGGLRYLAAASLEHGLWWTGALLLLPAARLGGGAGGRRSDSSPLTPRPRRTSSSTTASCRAKPWPSSDRFSAEATKVETS